MKTMDSPNANRRTGKNFLIIFLFANLFLIACSLFVQAPNIFQESKTTVSEIEDVSISNGELIYFKATSDRDGRISYSDGPVFGGMMMGTYLTCASCHGPEGRGGLHHMHMQVMDAPDIRYVALSGETGEHGHEEDQHDDEHGEYDLEAFRKAVIEGKHPDGKPISRDMPRWRMSDENLSDLFAYLKAIS